MNKILVINLGGSSSKLAVFQEKNCLIEQSLQHSLEEIEKHPLSRDQVVYRTQLIRQWLEDNNMSMEDFEAIALRATPIKEAIHGGTYLIDGEYMELVMKQYFPDQRPVHGTRIAVPIAEQLMGQKRIPMYVTDPGGSNELPPVARITGFKEYTRYPTCHALNQKAVARKYAAMIDKPYENCRFVVAHLGSGISVGAHANGGIINVNEGGEGYGPFSPQRAGTVETRTMLELCFDYGMTKDEVRHKIRNQGGMISHLGTDDMREVQRRIEAGDTQAALVFEAMAYQISGSIGARAAALCGKLDAILITGAIARSKMLIDKIKYYVEAFAPVAVFAGEFENEALALGAYRIMCGEEALQTLGKVD